MDKRTLLAVVLSVVVITVGFVIQNFLFPPIPQQTTATATGTPSSTQPGTGTPSDAPSSGTNQAAPVSGMPAVGSYEPAPEPGAREESVSISTEKYIATFSTAGGVLTSLKLKEHREGNSNVEMLYGAGGNASAFGIGFGGPESKPGKDLFSYRKISDTAVEFYLTYNTTDPATGTKVPLVLRKKFAFTPDDYMLELDISIENSVNEIPGLVYDGYAYTLGFGPQIGPKFTTLDGKYDYRKFFVYEDGKRKAINVGKQDSKKVEDRFVWAAIAGKYFTVIAIPDATLYTTTLSSESDTGLSQTNKLFFSRPPLKSSKSTDVFRFYIGPKLDNTLSRYNDSDRNGFGVKNLELNRVMDSSAFLGWLEAILKYILLGFYKVIPNYGIAIILLTLLIKVILWPLTHKSIESTSKMQALAPKIEEIKQKHKNSPNKMNQEMAELYKREGANPLGGCLPMLLQIPIFFALYNLLNSHFDLRGSVFIPGWISDLSSPESVYHLPFKLPLLGWSDLRLLPFIYVGTQILTQKFTTAPDTSGNNSMKMMMYMLPLVFFFIMYDMPSGLLLYWTMTNILSTAQQIYSTRHLKAKRAADGGSPVRK